MCELLVQARKALFTLLIGLGISCSTTVGREHARDHDASTDTGQLPSDRWDDADSQSPLDGATITRDAAVNADAFATGDSGETPVDASAPQLPLQLDNLQSGQTLSYPLARLVGHVAPQISAIEVSANGDPYQAWPVHQGLFKALVRLRRGLNTVHLLAGGKGTALSLHYEPQSNPRRVRFVYVTAADGDGTFQAPPTEPSNLASAVARLELAADMLQTFTAESIYRQHNVRRTFNVVRDPNERADVLIHKSNLTLAQALDMSGGELWGALHNELSSLPGTAQTIHVAVMGFTRYDPIRKTIQGHTALGGGRLALFGSSTLHAWPEDLAQVSRRTQDTSVIDGSLLFDDSAGRMRAWANYATGLGATMHELGHCLGVYHTQPSGTYVMSRGFDNILRWFAVSEPSSATSGGLSLIGEQDEPRWYPGNAAWLLNQRYLDGVTVNYANDAPPLFDVTSARVRVSSLNRLRTLLFVVEGEVRDYQHFGSSPPQSTELLLQPYRNLYGSGASFNVVAIDDSGNTANSGEHTL